MVYLIFRLPYNIDSLNRIRQPKNYVEKNGGG